MFSGFLILCLYLFTCNEAETNTVSYSETKQKIDSRRLALKQAYLQAKDEEKKNIDSSIKQNLVNIISNDLYNYWEGTGWDFNGITRIPKQGKIACGYFVTTILQDAGVKLNRVKLSICPSLSMMKSLTSPDQIKNLSHLKFESFHNWIKQSGKSVYITGLDFHTGFIVNDGNEVWFIHSNYINKKGVVKEKLNESSALMSSKTRYVTNLTESKKFLTNWIFL